MAKKKPVNTGSKKPSKSTVKKPKNSIVVNNRKSKSKVLELAKQLTPEELHGKISEANARAEELTNRMEQLRFLRLPESQMMVDIGIFIGLQAKKNEKKIAAILETVSKKDADLIEASKTEYMGLLGKKGAISHELNTYKNLLGADSEQKRTELLLFKIKDEIIELFARGYNNKDVHRIILQVYKINLQLVNILTFKNSYEDIINERKKALADDVSDIRLSTKRGRLEELENLYNKHQIQYDINPVPQNAKILVDIIGQIRTETVGNQLSIHIDVEETLKIHIEQESFKSLNPCFIAISKVAARKGLNPMYFMAKLENSVYAKFNGYINPNIRFDQLKTPIYPSDEVYDFDKIEKEQLMIEQNVKEEIEDSTLNKQTHSEEKIEKVKNMKRSLLDILRAKSK